MTELAPQLGEMWLPPQEAQIIEFPRVNTTPLREDYAEHPFNQDFNVRDVLSLASTEGNIAFGERMYLVDFASQRKPGFDDELEKLDHDAHQEAVDSGGLLLYFRGDIYGDGLCRSFCAWRSIQDAKIATQKPAHIAAAQSVNKMYEWYQVTMREAWLEPSEPGFGFGIEMTHSSDGANHLYDIAV